MAYSFDWDPDKALSNRKKHRISFDEASSVFHDPLARVWFDAVHSADEDRYLIVGHSVRERVLIVSYALRPHDTIRIISARLATRKECREYEENTDLGSRGG